MMWRCCVFVMREAIEVVMQIAGYVTIQLFDTGKGKTP